MKPLTFQDAQRLLRERGFRLTRSSGSHLIFRHADGRRCVVPRHAGDIPTGTARAILRDMGIDPAMYK